MNLYSISEIATALHAGGANAATLLPSEPDPHFTAAFIVCRTD